MARGGRRQGQAGRAYSNRTDLNTDRAPQPGSSGTMPDMPPQGEQMPPSLLPDAIPSLDTPTMYPDRPVTTGLPTGPGAGPSDEMYRVSNDYNLLRAAIRRNPSNPDLRRVAAYLAARGDNNA